MLPLCRRLEVLLNCSFIKMCGLFYFIDLSLCVWHLSPIEYQLPISVTMLVGSLFHKKIKPNQTKPNQSNPSQAKPNQTKPNPRNSYLTVLRERRDFCLFDMLSPQISGIAGSRAQTKQQNSTFLPPLGLALLPLAYCLYSQANSSIWKERCLPAVPNQHLLSL